ncbi:MAG TPA: cytochrome c biogenesis protein CcsA [Gaiellaceae bacterium]|nr:cytochrome c biogenesis protein CcsA [Gaiellaceae bacterium]
MGELAVILFWPALAGYAEAAVAYAGDTLRPGRLVRHAIWGVRLGWLAQTALLVAEAAHADGFPWASWAGSLNLFVWMCVGAYLVWGCRAPYRLLGVAVMPLAVALLVLAWAAGGIADAHETRFGDVFLAFHVGLALAAFAGFTMAAALAALYLWQERRLKRRTPRVLRLRAPSLETLDSLAGRTIAVALPALTLAIGIGFARLQSEGAGLDATMAVTLLAWLVYAAYLVLRLEAGWRGRRAAYLALAGFLLVVLVRLVLTPLGHF